MSLSKHLPLYGIITRTCGGSSIRVITDTIKMCSARRRTLDMENKFNIWQVDGDGLCGIICCELTYIRLMGVGAEWTKTWGGSSKKLGRIDRVWGGSTLGRIDRYPSVSSLLPVFCRCSVMTAMHGTTLAALAAPITWLSLLWPSSTVGARDSGCLIALIAEQLLRNT